MRRVSSIVLVLVALACASSAYADTSVIPDTPDLPWANPTHESPLELLASRIDSDIAQRPVRVYCDSQTEWDAGNRQPSAWGYVQPPRWSPGLVNWVDSSTQAHLAPKACEQLWRYAKASTKPTKCPASRTVTTTRKVTVRYRGTAPVTVTRRVKVGGVWVKRRVTVKKVVWKTRTDVRTQTSTTELDPVPCYRPAIGQDVLVRSGDPAYRDYILAVQTLAHEAFHLVDLTAGKPAITDSSVLESRAECFGFQRIARVASALGAAEDDATSMALYYLESVYSLRQSSSPYWSAECRPGGALDLEPGTPSWPTG